MNEEDIQAIEMLEYIKNNNSLMGFEIEKTNREDGYRSNLSQTVLNLVDKQKKLIDQMKKFILDKKLMYEFLDMAKESNINE